MVFWLAVFMGAMFVAIAVEWGFVGSWIMFFHMILAVYLAIFLTPVLVDAIPSIAATNWGYAMAAVSIAIATSAVGYGICHVGLGGEMGVGFPVAFDTLGAGLLGFMTGFLLSSFLTFPVCLTPWSQSDFCKRNGFDVDSQQANIAYLCHCCDVLHSVVASADSDSTTWSATVGLLDASERKSPESK